MTDTLQRPVRTPPPAARVLPRWLSSRNVFVTVVVLIMLYLVAGPLVVLIGSSFQRNDYSLPFTARSVWTFENYSDLFGHAAIYRTFLTTLLFAIPSLVLATLIALTFSWLIERTNLPGRGLLFVLLVGQSGIPLLISSMSWSLLANPTNGAINGLLGHLGVHVDIYTLPGMIFVEALGLSPLTFLLVTASVRRMNGVLENAAEASGARRATILWRINLPLIRPALMGALIFQFVNSIESIDVPLIIGQPGHITVFATAVLNSAHPPTGLPDYGGSSTTGLALFVLALGPLLLYNRILGASSSYATVTGKTFRPATLSLGRWRRPVFVVALLYLCVSFLLPLLMLVWTSLQPFYQGISAEAWGRLTFSQWTGIWSSGGVPQAFLHTVVLGFSVAVGVMLLAMCVSWILVRSRSRFTWLLDALAFTPHATPGVVIGLAVLILYLVLPLPFYGTIWIIVIAQITQYISLGTRLTSGAMAQVQVNLEEAGAASGATMFRVWRRILIPLMRPAFFNGLMLVFMASIQNLSLPYILASPSNGVWSTLIYNRWTFGHVNQAAVLSIIMTALTVVVAVLVRRTGREAETSSL
jgi:iron(III) transport system permease protein